MFWLVAKEKWKENMLDGLLLWLLDRPNPKWFESLMRLVIFRLYLSFKRNVPENLVISSLKSSSQAVNEKKKNASTFILYFKIYLFIFKTTFNTFVLYTHISILGTM